MKTLPAAFLALLLFTFTAFAADNPPAAANAAPSSLVEVGSTYTFHGDSNGSGLQHAKVLKVLNDNWVEVQCSFGKVKVNLQLISYILEEPAKP
jgi:hypothetical protein